MISLDSPKIISLLFNEKKQGLGSFLGGDGEEGDDLLLAGEGVQPHSPAVVDGGAE